MSKTKKEDNEEVSEESAEKVEFRRIVEAYKLAYPKKWEEGGKKEELTAILEKMV